MLVWIVVCLSVLDLQQTGAQVVPYLSRYGNWDMLQHHHDLNWIIWMDGV